MTATMEQIVTVSPASTTSASPDGQVLNQVLVAKETLDKS
jgi:hypothetical protein